MGTMTSPPSCVWPFPGPQFYIRKVEASISISLGFQRDLQAIRWTEGRAGWVSLLADVVHSSSSSSSNTYINTWGSRWDGRMSCPLPWSSAPRGALLLAWAGAALLVWGPQVAPSKTVVGSLSSFESLKFQTWLPIPGVRQVSSLWASTA